MKELIYANFQLTRATGVPTTFTVDGVSIEMRKRGGAPPTAKKAKAKGPLRSAAKAGRAKRTPPRAPEAEGKAAAVRRAEPVPQ